jgi:signal transduction histidine kinase
VALTWWQILPPLLLLVCAVVLAVRYRNLHSAVRAARRAVFLEEERLLGSLALAEETVHRILLTTEIDATLRRMAVDCVEVLDLAGVQIELDPAAARDLTPEESRVQHGSCEGENTQRLPIRARGEEIGSLWFTPREGRTLGVRELHFLRLLANLTGIGIENLLFHREVRQANDDKRRFILATTHDLRSPMSTVQQLVTVLLDDYAGPLNEKQRDLLEKIRARSDHQLELITDLLNLAAELEGFAILRESSRVDLGEIFDRSAQVLQTQCEAHGLTCTVRRDAGSIWRTAVPSDLENVLGNLFSNAVKYTRPPGRVEVTLEALGGDCRLRVSDTGIGIPPDSLPSLFREYFRAPNAREITRHGTGLGLALVQHLVRKYGGRIQVESRLNEGTTFEVTLPVEQGGPT